MNKKNTRALASATVLSLVLTTAVTTANVKAAKGEATRIGGADRYATAANVATSNWEKSDKVILASGEGYADSLSASVLSKKLDAPIILTGSKELNENAKAAIKKLDAKEVYVIGGNASVSEATRKGLKDSGLKLVELGGQTRFETNLAIANYLADDLKVDASNVLVVNGQQGFSDALSVAPVAAAKGQILLIVSTDAKDAKLASDFVAKHKSKVTVVGTENVVPKSVYDMLKASERVNGGANRFATNLNILNHFGIKGDKLYAANATGAGYADALVGSALAGKFGAPLVLTDTKDSKDTANAVKYIEEHATKDTDLSVLGGEGVMPKEVVEAINKAVNPEVKELAVESIEAVNAKEMNVKFNKAINKSTVLNEKNEVQNIDLTLLGETKQEQEGVKGRLSEDGKVLTLIADGNFKAGKYLVEASGIESKVEKEEKAETLKDFNKIIEVKADTVRPTIVGTEKINAGKVKVKFSEPIKEVGTATFKYADGKEVKGITGTLSAGNSEVEYVLGNDVEAGKDIVATFNGQKDFADNLIAPTPATVKFRKGEKDGVAPKVADIKVLSSTKFEVKFSEELIGNPTIVVPQVKGKDNTVTIEQDSKDKTKYVCTLGEGYEDLTKVIVKGYTDLSGQEGKEYSKLENFTIKTVAPKVVSTKYIKALDKVSKENKEYVEITFDKDIVSNDKLTKIVVKGNHVKDYVTTPVNKELNKADLIAVEGNKKALRIEAKKIADIEGAVYDLTLEGFEDDTISPLIKGDAASSDALKISFTRGIDEEVAQSKGEPKVVTDGVVVDNNDKITITFDKELDGKAATDVNNYKVEGAVVEKATLRPAAKDGKQNVELTIKSGSNTFNGDRYISISGVKAKDGEVMKDYKKVISLNENVRPTVKEAKLTDSNKIALTFSEDIKTKDDKADFEIFVGEDKLEDVEFSEAINKDNSKVMTITLKEGSKFTVEQVSKGIVIKPAKGNDVTDNNEPGNALNFTSIKVVK